MSDEQTIFGGSPIVTVDDAVDFFATRTQLPCPACGYSKWNVGTTFLAANLSDSQIAFGLATLNTATGLTTSRAMPAVIASCKKCAFIRIHSMVTISLWIADGKPEFEEDDEA